MEDVTELIAKVTQDLGSDASDEEISQKVLEAIEALPEADRAQVLDQMVKGVSSGQLRRLDKEADLDPHAGGGETAPQADTAP
jgi:hypothetical protein